MTITEELQARYMTEQYAKIMPTVISLLRDYRSKLETDDFDSNAAEKMRKTTCVLDRLVSLYENGL